MLRSVGTKVAGSILVLEALYFVCVTIYMTAFGVSLASSPAYTKSFLEVSSLPVVAVGAFALLALAFTHIAPPAPSRPSSPVAVSVWKQPSTWGFVGVVVVHLALGLWFVFQGSSRVGPGLLLLAALLFSCAVLQYRVLSKTPLRSPYSRKESSAHGALRSVQE